MGGPGHRTRVATLPSDVDGDSVPRGTARWRVSDLAERLLRARAVRPAAAGSRRAPRAVAEPTDLILRHPIARLAAGPGAMLRPVCAGRHGRPRVCRLPRDLDLTASHRCVHPFPFRRRPCATTVLDTSAILQCSPRHQRRPQRTGRNFSTP